MAASAPRLDEKEWADFFDYEAQLNAYLADKAMLVLCFYPVPADRAADVSRTHPSTVSRRRGQWQTYGG